jgi:glycosyltransferase involved in cell wall biosynthesis
MTPRVSFVIPAYNAEVYLRDTLDSCLHQSEKKLEVIVVNDGSTDGTKELVEFYAKKDKRVRLIHLDANVGRSEARNIGNREAKADIICVLDADDMATRDRVKNTIICFETKKPDIMYGGWIQIDTFGNMERRIAPQPFSKEQSLKYKTHFICHSSVAYRKGVTLNIQYQGGDCSRLGIDDWRFIWDCQIKGYKFAYAKPALCYYRMVEGTISKTRDESEVVHVKDAILKELNVVPA